MASSFFSFEFFGSSLKPSSATTHLWRSVNRTVIGSVSGNLSASAIAMSSVVVQVKLVIFDFPHTLILQRPSDRRIHDELGEVHRRVAQSVDRLANRLMTVTLHRFAEVLGGGCDFCFFFVTEICVFVVADSFH